MSRGWCLTMLYKTCKEFPFWKWGRDSRCKEQIELLAALSVRRNLFIPYQFRISNTALRVECLRTVCLSLRLYNNLPDPTMIAESRNISHCSRLKRHFPNPTSQHLITFPTARQTPGHTQTDYCLFSCPTLITRLW